MPPTRITSAPSFPGVREEELHAADLVVGNGVLAIRRNQPVDKGLVHVLLHVRVLGWVHEDHPVLVEEALVAFLHDYQLAAVLNDSQVPRSASAYAFIPEAVFSVGPMPEPVSR